MIETIEDFYAEAAAFVPQIDNFAVKHNLVESVQVDHICYKCDSAAVFEKIRSLFEHESEYLHQAIISGRRIAYIKFKQPIETSLGPINYLELSDQKPDGSQQNRFDHFELYPLVMSYDELVSKLGREGEEVTLVERPHHTTHNIKIGADFLLQLTREPLVEKIKREEM